MIPVPSAVRVWLATGVTDMRRGMNTLALQVQQDLGRDPHAGDLYVFRGRRGDLIKILWHDGLGISLYAKRLEHGSFGRRRPTERCRSLRRSSATCWKGSTGATRFGPGARRGPVELRLTMADVGEPGQELPGGGACDSLLIMAAADSHDTEGLKAALVASEARAAAAEAKVSDAEARVAALTLMIEKLRRALYGRRSERKERLLDQLELALDELTASATEDELAAERAAARTTEVSGFVRRKPSRKPFPEHLPRERVVVPGPASCTCCGSERLSKIGEDVTETLEGLCCKLGEGAMRDQGASCSPYVSALARRSCSNAIASVRAHGPRPKARSTIRASPTMPPWRANIPAWPLRSARITSKPLIVA